MTLEAYVGDPVTIGEVFRDYYEREHSLKDIYRFLAAPLAERARGDQAAPGMPRGVALRGVTAGGEVGNE